MFSCAFVWDSNRFIHIFGALKLYISQTEEKNVPKGLSVLVGLLSRARPLAMCRCWISMSIFVVSFGSFTGVLCVSLFCLTYAANRKQTHTHTIATNLSRIRLCVSRAHSLRRRIHA